MAATQNTLIMLPGDVMTSANINRANLEALMECSRVTGISLSRLLNAAADLFLEVEAPILMHKAAPSRHGWGQKVTGRRGVGA